MLRNHSPQTGGHLCWSQTLESFQNVLGFTQHHGRTGGSSLALSSADVCVWAPPPLWRTLGERWQRYTFDALQTGLSTWIWSQLLRWEREKIGFGGVKCSGVNIPAYVGYFKLLKSMKLSPAVFFPPPAGRWMWPACWGWQRSSPRSLICCRSHGEPSGRVQKNAFKWRKCCTIS